MSTGLCYIYEGKITNPEDLKKQFGNLKDGVYAVKIATRSPRTIDQNAYYWGVVCDMVKDGLQDAGYQEVKSDVDAHEIMKTLFLKERILNKKKDQVKVIIRSTTSLSTAEFNTYIAEIIQWAAEYLCIQIPFPNEKL